MSDQEVTLGHKHHQLDGCSQEQGATSQLCSFEAKFEVIHWLSKFEDRKCLAHGVLPITLCSSPSPTACLGYPTYATTPCDSKWYRRNKQQGSSSLYDSFGDES